MKQTDYRDMIEMEYPFPPKRPRMDKEKRAAQFAPFSALSGLSEKMEEARIKEEEDILRQDRGIPMEETDWGA